MKFEDLTNPQLKKVIKTYRLHLLEGITGYSSFDREKLISICKKFFDIDDEKIKPKVSEPIFFDIPPKPEPRKRVRKTKKINNKGSNMDEMLKQMVKQKEEIQKKLKEQEKKIRRKDEEAEKEEKIIDRMQRQKRDKKYIKKDEESTKEFLKTQQGKKMTEVNKYTSTQLRKIRLLSNKLKRLQKQYETAGDLRQYSILSKMDDTRQELKEIMGLGADEDEDDELKKLGLSGGSGAASSFNYDKFDELKNEAIKQEGKEDQTIKYIEDATVEELDNLEDGLETLVLFNPDYSEKITNLPVTLQNIYIVDYESGQGPTQPLHKLFPRLPFNCKVQRIEGTYHEFDYNKVRGKAMKKGIDIHITPKLWVELFSNPPFNDSEAISAKKYGYTVLKEYGDGTVALWINYSHPEMYNG